MWILRAITKHHSPPIQLSPEVSLVLDSFGAIFVSQDIFWRGKEPKDVDVAVRSTLKKIKLVDN
jgi:C4-dicarboxylate-specific signal transduction histidine kinase